MSIARFIIWFAAFVLVAGCSCSAQKPTPDPLAGFMDDYQDYIQKLSPDDKKYNGGVNFFEDGTGQHAVVIEIDLKPNAWNHVLIYDKDNKRINAIKYIDHQFRS
jgi:hypothetical protein